MEIEFKTDFSAPFMTRGSRARKELNGSLLFYEEKFDVYPRNVNIGIVALGETASRPLMMTNMGSITSRVRFLPQPSNSDVTISYESGATKVAPGITTRVNVVVRGTCTGKMRATLELYAGKEKFRVPVYYTVVSLEEHARMAAEAKEAADAADEFIAVRDELVPTAAKAAGWDPSSRNSCGKKSHEDVVSDIIARLDADATLEEVLTGKKKNDDESSSKEGE